LTLTPSPAGNTTEPQPETPKVDFWSVMRPLIEAPVEGNDSTGTEQRTVRQHPNPRRRR